MATATISRPTLGPIRDDETYPLPLFKALTGLGQTAIRSARRRGLAVRYDGGRAFIDGAEYRRYLRECGKDTK
jgi:hypothetical protein